VVPRDDSGDSEFGFFGMWVWGFWVGCFEGVRKGSQITHIARIFLWVGFCWKGKFYIVWGFGIFMRWLVFVLFFGLVGFVGADVIFEDDFDSHNDWHVPYQSFSVTWPNAGVADFPSDNPLIGPRMFGYSGQNSVIDNQPNHRITLFEDAGRGSGKGLRMRSEAIYGQDTTHSVWYSDTQTYYTLTENPGDYGYDEIWIQMWRRYGPDFYSKTSGAKYMHASHFRGEHLNDWHYDSEADVDHAPFIVLSNTAYDGDTSCCGSGSSYDDLSQNWEPLVKMMIRGDPYEQRADYRPRVPVEGSFHHESSGTYYGDYVYPGGSTSGSWQDSGRLGDGEWHYHEVYLKMNSAPGTNDGELGYYIDGVAQMVFDDVPWIQSDGEMVGWNMVSPGGNQDFHTSVPGGETYYYDIDDFVVSTHRVGMDYVIGSGGGCVSDLVNSSWSDWVNLTSCRVDDIVLQERSLTQSDNAGCVGDVEFLESRDLECSYDAPVVVEGVLFEDSFNGFFSGWTPSINDNGNKFYPWTIDETYNPEDPGDNGGGYGGLVNYEPSVYPESERTNSNSWNGWVQYPSSTGRISIQPSGGVEDSPVLRMRLVKWDGLSNEIGIHKWLGNVDNRELYIQYKVKFGSTGEDFWWGGEWANGNPEDNIIWKFGRVWTGFNPIDYDKTLGQTQPVENTVLTDESNWRTGIWIFRWRAADWNSVKNSVYFDVANFYASLSCTPNTPTCDSQSPSRDPLTGNIWDWAHAALSSMGRVNVFGNSGNDMDSDGTFSEVQDWHTVEMYFKNRANPETADGDMKIWIDGNEITNEASVSPAIVASMSANPNDYGMNFVRFGDNFNGLTNNIPDDPGYMDVFVDDVVISSEPIGYDYVIGGGGGVVSCVHEADVGSPCDGVVSLGELVDYVELWLGGRKSIGDVLGAVGEWKE